MRLRIADAGTRVRKLHHQFIAFLQNAHRKRAAADFFQSVGRIPDDFHAALKELVDVAPYLRQGRAQSGSLSECSCFPCAAFSSAALVARSSPYPAASSLPGDCWAKLSRLETSSRVRRRLLADLARHAGLIRFQVRLGRQQLGVSQDGRQRIVDLVGRSRHQLRQRCQLFSLHQFSLQPLHIFQAGARLFQQTHQFPVHQTIDAETRTGPAPASPPA